MSSFALHVKYLKPACLLLASSAALAFLTCQLKAQPLIEVSASPGSNGYHFGETIRIEWSEVSTDLPVTLSYSTDGGRTWEEIATVSGAQYHDWKLPEQMSDSYRFRASINDIGVPWKVVDTLEEGDGIFTDDAYFLNDTLLVSLDASALKSDSCRIWNLNTGAVTKVLPSLPEGQNVTHVNRSILAVSPFSGRMVLSATGLPFSSAIDAHGAGSRTLLNSGMSMTSSRIIFPDRITPGDSGVLLVRRDWRHRYFVGEYDLQTGSPRWVLDEGSFPEPGGYLGCTPRGDFVCIYQPPHVKEIRTRLFSGESGKWIADAEYEVYGLDVWYTESGDEMVVVSNDGMSYFFDALDMGLNRRLRTHTESPTGVSKTALSPNGRWIVVSTGTGYRPVRFGLTNTDTVEIHPNVCRLGNALMDVEFTPDSRLIAVGYKNGMLGVFDAETGSQVASYEDLHPEGVRSIVFSSDGSRAVTAGYEGRMYVWQTSMNSVESDVDIRVQAPDLNPGSIWFPYTDVGESRSATSVVLRNTSEFGVTVPSHIVHGPQADDFRVVTGGAPFTLQPGEQRAIEVEYSPSDTSLDRAWIEFAAKERIDPIVVDLYGGFLVSSVDGGRITNPADRLPLRFQILGGTCIISIDAADGDCLGTLELYDVLGRQVLSHRIDLYRHGIEQVNVDNISPLSCYFAIVKLKSGATPRVTIH